VSEPPRPRNLWVLAAQLTAVAWEFLGTILAGALVGYFLDGHFDTAPWGLIVCTLLGSTTGLYRMVVLLKRFERKTPDE
jgi:F0F1-type ATP synthase assembly protein I